MGFKKKLILHIWITLLGTEGFLQHQMKLLGLPGSCTSLVLAKNS